MAGNCLFLFMATLQIGDVFCFQIMDAFAIYNTNIPTGRTSRLYGAVERVW